MSIKLLSAIWEKQIGPGAERDVLMIYADHAGDDGRVAWPTVATVAWKAGYSERQTQRTIRKLQKAGVLQAAESNKGEKRGVRYRVNLDAIPNKPAPTGDTHMSPQKKGTGDTQTSPVGVTPICHPTGDTHMSPKPSIQPSSQPPTLPADAGAGSGDAPSKQTVDGVVDFFNRAAASNEQAAGDDARARLIADARKVFGKWNLPAHLSELATLFVELFNVAPENATKNQEGKWVAGLSRLYGQKPTRDELDAARKRARDARPAPLTITHPGAIVETLKAVRADALDKQTQERGEEDFVTIIDADGYERAVPKSKAHLYANQHASAVPA